MPWTMNDYPSSLKNLDKITKMKAIDIANAMVDEGYDEDSAIPIATEQAKEWVENASGEELKRFKNNAQLTKRSEEGKQYENNPERLDEAEEVVGHENGWAVQSSGAKNASHVFRLKGDAVEQAKEIAKNKGTRLIVYKKDGSIQEERTFE
ncbi:DUF2188 domain-containing protein [Virgibacillus sp. W0181]|uniref:DUF2188 domain-containing protein n=1 Tax=Virgibacillus sp. W0181 TaxID=3391581 RepID=UPI003F489DF2